MVGHILDVQFPEVNPAGAPGGDFEHIQSSPDMFGGLTARAFGTLGEGVTRAADTGLQYEIETAQYQNQIHASELHSWFSDKAGDIISNYAELQGKAALDALPGVKKNIADLQQQAEGQAGNLQAKSMVSANTRRTMDWFIGMATRHADSQRTAWATATAKNNLDTAINVGGLAITAGMDFGKLDEQMRTIGVEAHNYYDQQFPNLSDPSQQNALDSSVSKYKGAALKNWVETAATNEKDPDNIGHAMALFERYTKDIDPGSRLAISKYLNAKVQARAAGRLADIYIGAANGNVPQPFIDAYAFFIDRGYTPVQAAGIVGGLRGETANLNPTQIHDGGIGLGIAGWNRDRLDALKRFADENGGNPTDLTTQLEFVDHELRTTEGGAMTRLQGAQTPEEAGRAMLAYFRPSGWNEPGAHPERAQYARSIFNVVSGASPRVQIDADAVVNQVMADPLFANRPELQKAVIQNVLAKAGAMNRAANLKHKADQDASDAAELQVFGNIHSDKPTVTLDQILANPYMTREAKERMATQLEHVTGKEDKADKTYGTAFYDLYRRIHLPDGDPNRLADPSELYGHVGPHGDLTVAGVDKLFAEIQGRKTPEGVAESEMKAQFLKNARAQITGTDEGLHIKDPKGDELYLKFLAQVLPRYQEARNSGKTPSQLLDPDSPDYIGKGMIDVPGKNFRRPMSEWYADVVSDQNQAKPGAFDIKSIKSLDDAAAAYKRGDITREIAKQLAIDHPEWGVTFAPQANQPQVPISQ